MTSYKAVDLQEKGFETLSAGGRWGVVCRYDLNGAARVRVLARGMSPGDARWCASEFQRVNDAVERRNHDDAAGELEWFCVDCDTVSRGRVAVNCCPCRTIIVRLRSAGGES